MNEEKARFFDAQATAPWADRDYGPDEAAKLARLLGLLPGLWRARVLEPGCGAGRLTLELARAVGPGGRITALDISAGMTARARERLAGHPGVTVRTAALEDLGPDCGAPFDIAVCHQVFPHFDDQPAALARLAGLLRPGGTLVVSHFITRAQVNDVHRKAGTAVERDLLPDEAGMRRMLDEAGFAVRSLEDDDLGYYLAAERG
ncbi:MAG: trans-aconitate 2-methyltransferase [Desulfovibrionaceae bacterium]